MAVIDFLGPRKSVAGWRGIGVHKAVTLDIKPCALAPVLLMTALFAPTASNGSVEAWANPKLPVTDGLVLWLDASRQNAARQARQLPLLADGSELAVWFDGSG